MRTAPMDAYQSYCVNFLVLTRRWGCGSIAIVVAWALSVLGVALTVTAAWLIGERLSTGPGPIDVRELSWLEFWTAIAATVLAYLRLFRFALGAKSARQRRELLNRQSGSAAFAVVALLGPLVVVSVMVTASG